MSMEKRIIFDTDIGGDCDDAGALAVLQEAVRAGRARLMAVTVSTPNPYASACADAINRWYGNIVPIGLAPVLYDEDASYYEQWYGRHIAKLYPNAFYPSGAKPPNAVRLLRELLVSSMGEKVTIVVVGPLNNMCALIKSGSDDISPLNGSELLALAAEEIVVMGGEFSFDGTVPPPECNIKSDIESAKFFFDNCRVPVVVSHYTLGLTVLTGKVLIERDRKNPVAEAYEFHSKGNRCSWDPIAAYYAVYGTNGVFTLSEAGKVTIDGSGVSEFVKDVNGRHRLLDADNDEIAAAAVDTAMCKP